MDILEDELLTTAHRKALSFDCSIPYYVTFNLGYTIREINFILRYKANVLTLVG